MRFATPIALFLALVALLGAGLRLDPHEIPSPLIGKPAPDFVLVQLDDTTKHFSPAEVRGKVWLLNTWASWCEACRAEHGLLLQLARRGVVPIYGLDYKDRRDDAIAMLRELGNPFVLSIQDTEGRTGIDYGVYGVPETYLIDKNGVIRYKRIGALTAEIVQSTLLPLVGILNE